MRKILLASAAAAALCFGVGVASAQAPANQGAQGAQGTEHAQPTGKVGNQGARNQSAGAVQGRAQTGKNGREAAGSQKRAHGATGINGAFAQGNAQNEKNGRETGVKGRAQEQRHAQHGTTGQTTGKSGRTTVGATEGNRKPGGTNSREGAVSSGQAGGGGRASASLSNEQRGRIRTAIIGEHVQPAPNVNFNVRVGTAIPSTVRMYPLPAQIVTIEPRWRGYEFFLVGSEIVIVDPATLRIVAVMPA
jgi:hypothetical protein